MADASPTKFTLSPNWRTKSGVANSLTPERKTWLILTPNLFRNRRESIFLPFISGRVMSTSNDVSCWSRVVQSIPFLFQSVSSCSPNNTVNLVISFSEVTTNNLSLGNIFFSDVGMLTIPSLHKREMINLEWLIWAISFIVLLKIPGLWTWNSAMKVSSFLLF